MSNTVLYDDKEGFLCRFLCVKPIWFREFLKPAPPCSGGGYHLGGGLAGSTWKHFTGPMKFLKPAKKFRKSCQKSPQWTSFWGSLQNFGEKVQPDTVCFQQTWSINQTMAACRTPPFFQLAGSTPLGGIKKCTDLVGAFFSICEKTPFLEKN